MKVQVGDPVPLERGEFADQIRSTDVEPSAAPMSTIVASDRSTLSISIWSATGVSVPAGDLDRTPDAHRGHRPGELIPGSRVISGSRMTRGSAQKNRANLRSNPDGQRPSTA